MKTKLGLLLILPLCSAPAKAEVSPLPVDNLCNVINTAAAENGLPPEFLTRLIWQESRFDALAQSSAGARGVAQFMPKTASGRGLLDPFEPVKSLFESAAYLRELRQTFGNLGLAAAAYNVGPGHLGTWIAGQGQLPQETINYVEIVTGHSVSDWRSAQPPALDLDPGFSCVRFAARAGEPFLNTSRARSAADGGSVVADPPKPRPWAVILVGSFQQSATIAEYHIVRVSHSKVLNGLKPSFVRRHLGGEAMMKYVAQIEETDRDAADRLCKRLQSSGGSCTVLRNILQ